MTLCDEFSKVMCEEAKADAVLCLVLGGEHTGMSLSTVEGMPTDFLPALLESMAKHLREESENVQST